MVSETDALRQTIRSQTDKIAEKKRFALFSQPPPLYLGDTTFYATTHPRDQSGKPTTLPKNITVSNVKKGSHPSTLFTKTSYITTDNRTDKTDFFMDSSRRAIIQQKTKRQTGMLFKDEKFKAGYFGKTIMHAPYEWIPRNQPVRDPKAYKTQDCKVITQPPNILNNSHNNIRDNNFKHHKYMGYPQDSQKKLDNQARRIHQEKLLKINQKNNGRNFCGMHRGNKPFHTSKSVYQDTYIKRVYKPKRNPSIATHDNNFKPSTPGYGHAIQKFPEYIQNPIPYPVRKQQGQKKQPYKLNHVQILTRPTPSITLLPGNNIKYKI